MPTVLKFECGECGRWRKTRQGVGCRFCAALVCRGCERGHLKGHPPELGAARRHSVTQLDRLLGWTVAK